MTTAQITEILNDLGYSVDMFIPLTEINAIVLEGNFNIYPDGLHEYKFDTEHELLLVYQGKVENGIFTPNSMPKVAHAFDQILAFQLVSKTRHPVPYRFGVVS